VSNPSDDESNGGGHRYGYDPKQARVPAGYHGGGQWTRGGYGPQEQAARLALLGRKEPLPRVQSPPLAPTARPPSSPKPGLRLGPGVWGALIWLLESLHEEETRLNPVMIFKGRDYHKDADGVWRFQGLELLTEDDIQAICGKEGTKGLQGFLDQQAKKVAAEKLAPGPAGTKAHQGMKEDLDGQGNSNVLTEVLIKKNEDTGEYEEVDQNNNPKGSIRLDLRIINGEKTVCVGDHKFGVRGLSAQKISDIFAKASEIFPNVTRFFIFEGRPIAPLNRRLQDR